MFVNPSPPGKLPVSLIEPGCILYDSTVHISDVETAVRADCGVDEAGIEVGGAKELLALSFSLAKHQLTTRIFHMSPADYMKGGVAEKIGPPGVIGEFIAPINGLSAGRGESAHLIDLASAVSG
tara:strand:- start:115 stop:486 length:372 start_codon:yes stop_codon:yes gene_type:complete